MMNVTDQTDQRNRLVEDNLGLVRSVAHKWLFSANRKSETFDDLFQAGCLGLIRAAEKYDPSLGFAFSTYAIPWIQKEIRQSLFLELPAYVNSEVAKIKYQISQMELAGEQVSVDLLAKYFPTLSPDILAATIPMLNKPQSLSEPSSSDGNQTLLDVYKGVGMSLEDEVEEKAKTHNVCKAVKRLSRKRPPLDVLALHEAISETSSAFSAYANAYEKWHALIGSKFPDVMGQEVILAHWGLGQYQDKKNFEELAVVFKVSKQCIAQKERTSLKYLKLDPLIIGANRADLD